jgi:transcriptional regulator with XRE-family HTH domain
MSTTMHAPGRCSVGELLREWRERRRLSQLDLAIQADISARHLSFVETGRSRPTPAMILRLTGQLQVPLRERNVLLLAGGYAPAYPQYGLQAPERDSVRAALRQVLAGHKPYPAVVIDRWWDMQDGNSGVAVLVEGCAPAPVASTKGSVPTASCCRCGASMTGGSLRCSALAPRLRRLLT